MKNAAYFFLVIAAIILVLVIAKGLIIPLVFALLFWFLTRRIRFQLDKISFVQKYLPPWSKSLIVFTLIILTFAIIGNTLSTSIASLSASFKNYEPNIQHSVDKVEDLFDIDLKQTLGNAMGDFDYGETLSNLANSITGVFGDTFMIIIYVLFIFLEERSFARKLKIVLDRGSNGDKINEILHKIEGSVADYLKLKTIVSLLTGFLSYLVLVFVGIDSPVFWSFLIFLLNFIPTIGSLIATVFPATFSLIQFGEFAPFIGVLVAVGLVQVIVGNIVEPKLMGKSLNVSPIVTIVALAVWGKIWGITGMILSVPITIIVLIVLSHFEKTKAVAIMLTENGKIEED